MSHLSTYFLYALETGLNAEKLTFPFPLEPTSSLRRPVRTSDPCVTRIRALPYAG